MKRRTALFFSALVVTFTASCWQSAVQPIPLSEGACRPGDSVSVAAGLCAGTGMLYSLYTVAYWEYGLRGETRCDRYTAAEGTFRFEAGKGRLKLVSSGSFGFARMTDTFWHTNDYYWHNPAGVSRRAYPLELSAGCKICIGRTSALRLTTGGAFCFFDGDTAIEDFLLPLMSADAIVLQDFGPCWTAGAGIGLRGLQLGAAHHLPFRKGLAGHVGANLLYYGWPIRWAGAEPRVALPLALQMGITVGSN